MFGGLMVAILGGLWLWAGQDWSGHLCLNGLWPCVWLLAFGVWVSHGVKA